MIIEARSQSATVKSFPGEIINIIRVAPAKSEPRAASFDLYVTKDQSELPPTLRIIVQPRSINFGRFTGSPVPGIEHQDRHTSPLGTKLLSLPLTRLVIFKLSSRERSIIIKKIGNLMFLCQCLMTFTFDGT